MGIAIQKCQSGQRRQVPPIVQSRVNRWPLRSDAKHIARTAWEPNQRYRLVNEGSLAKPDRHLCRDSGRRQANCRYIFGLNRRRRIAARSDGKMPTMPTKANGFGGRGIADCLNLCGLRGISAGKVCRRHGPLPGRYLTCSRLAVVNRVRPPCWQQFLMETYGGPAQPSPSIGQCLNGGYGG